MKISPKVWFHSDPRKPYCDFVIFFFFWASSSNHCLAALDLGVDADQPFDCLIVQNRQAMQSVGRSMDCVLGQFDAAVLATGRFGDGGRKCIMRKTCVFLKYFEG